MLRLCYSLTPKQKQTYGLLTLHNNGVVLSVLSVAEGLNCTAKDSPIAFLWRRHVLYCRWHIRHVAGLCSCRVRGEKRGLFQISMLRSRAFVCPEVNSTLDFPRPFFFSFSFILLPCRTIHAHSRPYDTTTRTECNFLLPATWMEFHYFFLERAPNKFRVGKWIIVFFSFLGIGLESIRHSSTLAVGWMIQRRLIGSSDV